MLNNHKSRISANVSSDTSNVDTPGDSALTTTKAMPTTNRTGKPIVNVPIRTKNTTQQKVNVHGKSDDLSNVKVSAINQLENTIKMADIIESKNRKIINLQTEIKSLKIELRQSQENVMESNRVNGELMDQIQTLTSINSRQKIDLEYRQTADLINDIIDVPTVASTSYSRYVKDIVDNREQLLEENDRLNKTIADQQRKMHQMNSYIVKLEDDHNGDLIDYKYIDQTTTEERSKSDLLRIIRAQMDDKVVWVDYGIKLTEAALAKCPSILGIDCSDEVSQSQGADVAEERWAKLAVTMLHKISHSCPRLLQTILRSADQDQISYLNERIK